MATIKKPLAPQEEQVMPMDRPLTKEERKEKRTKGKIIKKKK